MRIDGSYLFPAPTKRLFAALLCPGTLARTIPKTERLIQLGPPDDDGGVTFKAWVRGAEGLAVLTWCLTPMRHPDSLRLRLWGHLPGGRLDATGMIDLVAREDAHTRGAYAVELEAPEGALDPSSVQALAGTLCERLAELVYRPEAEAAHSIPAPESAALASAAATDPSAVPVSHRSPRRREITSPRGHIVARPVVSRADSTGGGPRAWMERALWMGAGLALGLAAVGLVLAVAHRLNGPDT